MPLVLTSGFGAKAGAIIQNLFKEAKALYAPGGQYMKGIKAQLARGRTRAVAGGMQGLAAAGLAGTSMAGGLAKKYEEEVAAPAMAQATTARLSALSGLLAQEAGAELQMAPRYGYQAPQARQQQQRGVSIPSVQQRQIQPTQPRVATQPRQPAQQQQQLPPAPTYPKTFAPAGQWQGTIGGMSFYSTGTGGITQTTSAPKKPLSSYYDVGNELGM